MISNLTAEIIEEKMSHVPVDSSVNFSDYIERCQNLIKTRRIDINKPGVNSKHIIECNSPFELYPASPILSGSKIKYGALLIQGLFDCPFSLRDIGNQLQNSGIFCRSILLPGHGTVPSDLISVRYQDWVATMRYGIESLAREVDKVILIGYSTGAALSVYQALQDPSIAGIVLLAPAIKIKAPIDFMLGWQSLVKWMNKNKTWVYREDELDYTKYLSLPFNPVNQLSMLTTEISHLHVNKKITCPIFMSVSREDETISSHTAIDFFADQRNPESKLLLYTSHEHVYPDPRIKTRLTKYPDLNIKHFSHVCMPFSPDNTHYGPNGDYVYASHTYDHDYYYGAYNNVEESILKVGYKLGLMKYKRRALTYNPDFNFMANEITSFIQRIS